MIYLNPSAPNIQQAWREHRSLLIPYIQDLRKANSNTTVKKFLDNQRLIHLLSDSPDKLLQYHQEFLDYLPGYSLKQWEDYLDVKKFKHDHPNKKLTATQNNTLDEYVQAKQDYFLDLGKIIKYVGGFARKSTKNYNAYHLAEKLNIQTCPYCNRLYTKTVLKPYKVTRPEFDHWFPKSTYPLLALSFYNLIPSCHVCNSNVKGAENMSLNKYLHPYVDTNINYQFSYKLNKSNTHEFKIIRDTTSKEDHTIKAFKIENIYKTHEEEIQDLVSIKTKYSIRYLLELKKLINTPNSKHRTNLSELYRLAFGTYDDPVRFHKRPLSKMKYDILKELGMYLPPKS